MLGLCSSGHAPSLRLTVLLVLGASLVARTAHAQSESPSGESALDGRIGARVDGRIEARVAVPLAVLTPDAGDSRAAGGLLFGIGVRALSNFVDQDRGWVLDDRLEASLAGSPFRSVGTGGCFAWRYDLAVGYRGARRGLLAGGSVDTVAWAFTDGTTFTSAALPLQLRFEQQVGPAASLVATGFATLPRARSAREGGELRLVFPRTPQRPWIGAGLSGVAFYARLAQVTGTARRSDGSAAPATVWESQAGVIETFR
jgi:hypothetical protein